MVTNTRPSPPNLVSVVSQVQHESYQAWLQAQAMNDQQHHFQSQQNVAQQQAYENDLTSFYQAKSAWRELRLLSDPKHEPTIPKEYEELADPSSPMFDPLTCIKNGVKVKEKKPDNMTARERVLWRLKTNSKGPYTAKKKPR